MRRLPLGHLIGLLAAVAVLAGLSAGALAFWAGDGSGTATAVVGTPQDLTLTPGTPAGQLYPGASAGAAVAVTNPNSHPVRVGSLALDPSAGTGGFDVDSEHGGCDLSAIHFTEQSNGGAGWQVPARVGATDGSLSIEMPASLTMDADAANACQGASFTIHLLAGS